MFAIVCLAKPVALAISARDKGPFTPQRLEDGATVVAVGELEVGSPHGHHLERIRSLTVVEPLSTSSAEP